MKVIKTITCHNVYNHGATLQEYALIKYIQSLGYNVSSINYKPHYLSNHHNLWFVSNPKYDYPLLKQIYLLFKLPSRIKYLKRKKNFDKFESNYIRSDKYVYKSNNDLKNKPPKADIYVCGSDQIWNHLYYNGNDPAFYLDFAPNNVRRVSYAASIATNHIPSKLIDFYKDKLTQFDLISVRETSTKRILEDIGIENVSQVLDPVFLIKKEDWINEFVKEYDKNYIFVYDFDSNQAIKETAIYLKNKFSLNIITVNKELKYADKNLWEKDPSFFLSLIANARYVITNSFHATCFSIIFERPFLVFKRSENINARMIDLLELIGLKKNMIEKLDKNNLEFYEINYSEIAPLKDELILKSKDFLTKALKNK